MFIRNRKPFFACTVLISLIVLMINSAMAIGASQNIITSYGTIEYTSSGTKRITWADGQTETFDSLSSPIVSWAFHFLPINDWEGNAISGLETVLPQLSAVGIRVVKLYIPGDDLPSSGINYDMIGQALDILYANKMWVYIVQDNELRSDWAIDKQTLYKTPEVISFVCQKIEWANIVVAWSPENELEDKMASNNFIWTSAQLRNHVTWVHDALSNLLSSSLIGGIAVNFPMVAGYQIDPHSGENNCKILVDASDIPDFHCYRSSIDELIETIDGWLTYSNPSHRVWWSGECNWEWDTIRANGGICSWEYIQTMLNKGCSAAFIYPLEAGIYANGTPVYPATTTLLNAIKSYYNS
ncbi:MAG: hypothetical protein NWE95_07130 [Candidatus Bathyarchaeota archaeon]|nr:hypothetical protein [Candidatus Bathyarchaeota archaeon]